jgi:hypothetical protein
MKILSRPNLIVGKLPTQITAGRREVEINRREWSAFKSKTAS